MVPQMVRNDVSSTKVRLFIRRGMSVIYLIPTPVVKYIERHGLYRNQRYHGELGSSTPSTVSVATPSHAASNESLPRDTDMVAYDDHEDVDTSRDDDEYLGDAQIETILKSDVNAPSGSQT